MLPDIIFFCDFRTITGGFIVPFNDMHENSVPNMYNIIMLYAGHC